MTYYGYEFIRESDLTHHGIKGQKWGIRRFQNKDGSYTAAGRKRRTENESDNLRKSKHTMKKAIAVGGAIVLTGLAVYGTVKLNNLATNELSKEFIKTGEKYAKSAKIFGEKASKIEPNYKLAKKVLKDHVALEKELHPRKIEKTQIDKDLEDVVRNISKEYAHYTKLSNDYYDKSNEAFNIAKKRKFTSKQKVDTLKRLAQAKR